MIPLLVVLADVAGPLPEGLAKQDPASKGQTDVAQETFGAAASPGGDDGGDETYGREGTVAAGGLFSEGNTKSLAVTAVTAYRNRQKEHQFSWTGAVNYGRAAQEGGGIETTVENAQGLLRYDYFFLQNWSVFLQSSARRDKFQGLDLRLNLDPGVAYFVFDKKKHKLWFEAGYDYQHDIRRDANLAEAAAKGEPQDKTSDRHSIRGFVGYVNKLRDAVTFTTGVEYLQAVDPLRSWRVNWIAELKSAIAGSFSAATTLTLRYDHDPLPGVETTDAVTAVSLVYSFR